MASYLYNNFASDDNDNYNQKLNAQLNLLDANTDVDKLTQAFAKSFKNIYEHLKAGQIIYKTVHCYLIIYSQSKK